MSDNIRPQGRCCDCRFLGLMPAGEATCEGPIPAVWDHAMSLHEIPLRLTVADLMKVRRCDCYLPREVA